MATCGTYLHLADTDEPEVTLLPSGGVSVRYGEAVIFLTSPAQVDVLMAAAADAGAALMLAQETPGADETPER